jgi:hypothetical protein
MCLFEYFWELLYAMQYSSKTQTKYQLASNFQLNGSSLQIRSIFKQDKLFAITFNKNPIERREVNYLELMSLWSFDEKKLGHWPKINRNILKTDNQIKVRFVVDSFVNELQIVFDSFDWVVDAWRVHILSCWHGNWRRIRDVWSRKCYRQ